MPLMKISGTKTAQVVSTDESIGAITSCVPRTTASVSGSPRDQRAVMLSTTMIELSTIMPMPSTSPDSEMMLIEMCIRKKTSTEMISVTGMVRITSIGDFRSRMKKKMMTQASKAPVMMLFTRLLIE